MEKTPENVQKVHELCAENVDFEYDVAGVDRILCKFPSMTAQLSTISDVAEFVLNLTGWTEGW